MRRSPPTSRRPLLLRSALLTACTLLLAAPSWALYKVVGPDGRVTYTDRAPQTTGGATGQVSAVSAAGGVASGQAALPLELRQATQRFPVTLYTTAVCDPCEAARQFLRKRGVPFTERQVLSPADAEALFKLTGGREAPAATIGSQVMRGYAAELWGSYLDAAAYPKESKLPGNYTWPAATPLTARSDASGKADAEREAAPAGSAAPTSPATSSAPAAGTPRIRF